MPLTHSQAFDKKHNPRQEVLIYHYPVWYSKNNQERWAQNYAHPANKIGALDYTNISILATIKDFTTNWAGLGPTTTGEKLPILKAAATVNLLSFMVSGVYNTAASFYFRLGEAVPKPGQGNIIIDNTNITINYDDGSSTVVAHLGSWLLGDRFVIGLQKSHSSPLINKITNSGAGDVVTSAFAAIGETNKDITIADEFVVGAVSGPCPLSGFLLVQDSDDVTLGVQDQYDAWRKGDGVLTNGMTLLG